jgi:hypothetical protein
MKREIVRIIPEGIKTDETGKYCSMNCDGFKSIYGKSIYYCTKFKNDGSFATYLNTENNKSKRCQACHDAEKLARKVNHE